MNILDILTDYKYKVFNYHWWRDFYYTQISSRINPRNKWLIKKIPRTWVDKDTILEICVLESLKHYVEGEEGLNYYEESQKDPEYPDCQKEFDKEVKMHYDLLTKTLVESEKKLKKAWDDKPPYEFGQVKNDDDYQTMYGEIDKLEAEIYQLKTKIMTWTVINRDKLWT